MASDQSLSHAERQSSALTSSKCSPERLLLPSTSMPLCRGLWYHQHHSGPAGLSCSSHAVSSILEEARLATSFVRISLFTVCGLQFCTLDSSWSRGPISCLLVFLTMLYPNVWTATLSLCCFLLRHLGLFSCYGLNVSTQMPGKLCYASSAQR